MATPIQNRLNGHAVFRFTANATIALSDMSVNTSQENITNMAITKIFWTGDWTIKRGSNTVFTSNTNTADHWDLKGSGISLTEDSAATIVVNTTGTTSTLIIEVAKQTYANSGSDGVFYRAAP